MTVDEDKRFKVRILWTTTGMFEPIIMVSVPDVYDADSILDGIAVAANEHKSCVVTRMSGLPYVQIDVADMHVKSVRKNGTPPAPAVVRWLVKNLPDRGCLPPRHRLAFEVSWLKHGSRTEVIDVTLSGPVST